MWVVACGDGAAGTASTTDGATTGATTTGATTGAATGTDAPTSTEPTTATDSDAGATQSTGLPDTTGNSPATGSSTDTTTGDSTTTNTTTGATTSTTSVDTADTTTGEGGDSDTSDGSTTVPAPFCGDGVVDPGEACDDGNMSDDDACSDACEVLVQQLKKVYLTSCNGAPGFHGYDIDSDEWTTLASPPIPTYSQITNDGNFVYLLGEDNTIQVYDPGSDVWTPSATPGPNPFFAAVGVGYFKWTDQGFYYMLDGETELYHRKNDAWITIDLMAQGASAGSWDRAHGELYLRSWKKLGFRVLDTASDAVIRTIVDATPVSENSRTGSLSGEFFYGRTFDGAIQKLDRLSGAKTDTGETPTSDHTASDTDVVTGRVYFAGYEEFGAVFQRYDPADNTLTTLADSPPVPDHSTITVMLPE